MQNETMHPSKQDRETASNIKDAGVLMGTPLQDFIIIGDGNYYSFHDEGEFKKTKKISSKKRLRANLFASLPKRC